MSKSVYLSKAFFFFPYWCPFFLTFPSELSESRLLWFLYFVIGVKNNQKGKHSKRRGWWHLRLMSIIMSLSRSSGVTRDPKAFPWDTFFNTFSQAKLQSNSIFLDRWMICFHSACGIIFYFDIIWCIFCLCLSLETLPDDKKKGESVLVLWLWIWCQK